MTILSECRLPHCDNEFEFGNNGLPLIQGEVCDECISLVVMARLQLMERSNGTK